MGLCSSSKSIYTKHNHLTQWKNDFDALMVVDSDLEKLYKLFQAIDKDGSGEIDLVELIHYLRLTRTKFNKRVFTIFDEDGSGEIDFREFVVALWNYCTMGKSALTIFAFDLYDLDGSGEIELDEVECKKGVSLFRCVHVVGCLQVVGSLWWGLTLCSIVAYWCAFSCSLFSCSLFSCSLCLFVAISFSPDHRHAQRSLRQSFQNIQSRQSIVGKINRHGPFGRRGCFVGGKI
jgi:serine/threonine-protein phosphatase 2B regulatory subunit